MLLLFISELFDYTNPWSGTSDNLPGTLIASMTGFGVLIRNLYSKMYNCVQQNWLITSCSNLYSDYASIAVSIDLIASYILYTRNVSEQYSCVTANR